MARCGGKNCAQMCCKGIFHTFNALVWATSLILGGWIGFVFGMREDTPSVQSIDDTKLFISILLSVAVLIFILGLCGCCGVGAESFCLIKTYIIFMMLIVLAELTALIYMVVKEGSIGHLLDTVWWQVDKWSRSLVHQAFQCCGYRGWTNYTVSADANFDNCMSPEVVTISPDGATASPKHPDCLAAFKEWGKDGVHIWASVFVALVSSQAIAIFSSCAVYSAAYKKMEVRSSVENDKQKTMKNNSPPIYGQPSRNKRKVGVLAATNKRQKEGKSPSTISSSSETRDTYVRGVPSKDQMTKGRIRETTHGASRDHHGNHHPPPLPPDHPHHHPGQEEYSYTPHGAVNGQYNTGFYDQGYW